MANYVANASKEVIAEAFIKKVVSSYDMDESYLPVFKTIMVDVMTVYESSSVAAEAKTKRATKPKTAAVEPVAAPAAVTSSVVSAPATESSGAAVAPSTVVVGASASASAGTVADEKAKKKPNGYNVFVQEKIKTLPETVAQKDRMKVCADLWKTCDEATKESYRAKAAAM